MEKRIGYLIYDERIYSGLIQTQVLDLLVKMKEIDPSCSICLFYICQIYIYLKNFRKIKQIKQRLAAKDVSVKILLWSFPSRYLLFKRNILRYVKSIQAFLLRLSLFKFKIDILHCRGYYSILLANSLKKYRKLKTIFDMRSLFIDENVSINKIRPNSKLYKLWKQYEQDAFTNADKVVVINDAMQQCVSTSNTVIIPLCVDTNCFRSAGDKRNSIRAELNLCDKTIIVYEGNIGLNSWNNIYNYITYFKYIKGYIENAFFLILSERYTFNIDELLLSHGIERKDFLALMSTTKELPSYLNASDIGIFVMSPSKDSSTRFGVKFIEYLASGLPVILNANVGYAKTIVEKFGLGYVMDIENENKDFYKFLNKIYSEEYKNYCSDFAGKNFSVGRVGELYLSLYSSLYTKR